MRADRFKPGGLAWVSARVDDWHVTVTLQTAKGRPFIVKVEPGKPCTIIRRAHAKDYGKWTREVRRGKSYAKERAERSWFVLYEGLPTMIEDKWLNKRHYNPRKPRGKCVTAGTDGA